jgi:hypothetical protein
MKKLMFLLVVAFAFASCNRCQTCSYNGLADEEFCSSDFDSKSDFNDAMDVLEDAGWDCK